MAPRRCSLTGAVFFASRRRRLRLRRPLPPPPPPPSTPSAAVDPFCPRCHRRPLPPLDTPEPTSSSPSSHRSSSHPPRLLASSLLPACTNAAPPQPHQSRLLRQPRPPPPPPPSTAIATAAAHSTASSRGLPHRPRMEPTSSPSGAAVKLHRCHRSRRLELHNQLGLTMVNRLLPSAHFHGQCSKLYIRTYCKARSIHSIFCFICKSVLQLTNWMRTDVTCMYCSYILISSRSRKILMVCFSNCFLLLNVIFVFRFIAICHILLIDLNLYC
ncbi:formin-like protein 13 [Oryza glaberrima]|uniref:formin-like protein 13 n=1 Tax=Oryza glaberrima TaxID=4538 RepID=UPI00224C296F|nr:formin-like protein 13 [Oryza glaberrima]